ncbi:MAG: S8 family serine peptidase [archaeon]|nr:S8 family serine peptidase [archaeon]MCR4324040.1 S8 family serine peptidase [Nanoarchaeota archaeon]
MLLIFLLILSGFVFGMSGEKNLDKVFSESILDDFSKGNEKVTVVLKIKDNQNLRIKNFEIESKKISSEYVTREVSLKELQELQLDPSVEKIFSENHLHAFMGEATGVVKSNFTNNLKIDGTNLTGTGQTVCIIDTGIDFSHPDLSGKNNSCIIDCFDKSCIENCSIGDDEGHGTHVAGIVTAYGGITGIAPNVSLIGVKILDSNGDASGNSADLNNAIDWCVNENVTVITMSLGTVGLYSSSCEGIFPTWSNSINAAVAKNISVVAASGNDANKTHISSPACISNTIAVGDTYDTNVGSVNWTGTCFDETTITDQIVCHANRNSLVKLFAPGAMINSTLSGGGYQRFGGTSMATPMVAGAIALINQYLNLINQTKSPSEIVSILNNTGQRLDDMAGSGTNFTRINVYNAVLSLDEINPNVTLVSPENNLINLIKNKTFTCNTTDWQLANITFQIWNSTGLYNSSTANITGTSNESSFNLTNMSEGTYNWTCLSIDNQSNPNYATENFTLTIGGILVESSTPINNNETRNNATNFTCNSTSEANYSLLNITFYLWNATGLYNSSTKNITGTQNTTTFSHTFIKDGNYSWSCKGFNNAGKFSWSESNFTIMYDGTAPTISSVSASVTSSSATITWTTNESSNSSITGEIGNSSSTPRTSHSLSISSLTASTTYNYNVTSCDRLGNCNTTTGQTLTTSAAPAEDDDSDSDSGSGGGSTSTTTTTTRLISTLREVSTTELSTGFTKNFSKNEKIAFNVSNVAGGRHTLTVTEIGANYVDLLIESNPISLTVETGQSKSLNLTSETNYDISITLDSITSGKAQITLKSTNEIIEKEEVRESPITGQATGESGVTGQIKDNTPWIVGMVIVLGGVIYMTIFRNRKQLKTTEILNVKDDYEKIEVKDLS